MEYLRSTRARPDSDVDLLVEFLPGAHPTLLDVAQVEIELSHLLGGRKVDVRTAQDLRAYEKIRLWERACP